MSNFITLFIKGFVIGVGKIIPGVSGAVLAISLGIYEEAIKSINSFFSNPTRNYKFLGTLGLGVVTAIVLVSNVVKYALSNFYLPTMLLFIGLILGGIPILFTKVNNKEYSKSNVFISVVVFILVVLLSFLSNDNEINFNKGLISFWFLIVIGIIEAATMIIPGISGTAVMMLIGCYNAIIDTFSGLSDLSKILSNMQFLIPFVIGIFIGTIIIVKLMAYLFNNYEVQTYYAIIGFALSSVFLVLIQTFNNSYEIIQILFGMILLVTGYNVSRRLDS